MATASRSEMAIPKEGRSPTVIVFCLFAAPTVLAILDLFFFSEGAIVLKILCCLWLAWIASGLWEVHRSKGGYHQLFISMLSFFARMHFVESVPQESGPAEIRFGFRLFGRCLYYNRMSLDKIATVEWRPAPSNPLWWGVLLWRERNGLPADDDPKHNQDIYVVGPVTDLKAADTLGLALVEFLRHAGAQLDQRDNHIFVRPMSKTSSTTSSE